MKQFANTNNKMDARIQVFNLTALGLLLKLHIEMVLKINKSTTEGAKKAISVQGEFTQGKLLN